VDDSNILTTVHALVEEEGKLRSRLEDGTIDVDEEHKRLRHLEESLDQCWDLLRQRRARRDAGKDPDEATMRTVNEVEGYLQ
jgi:hypothetical protein